MDLACIFNGGHARLALQGAALICATAAHAEDRVEFGTMGPPFTIVLSEVHGETHVADLTVTNQLVWAGEGGDVYTLETGGISVTVFIDHGPGAEPDTIAIEAAPGFVAVPREITLEEGETGVVRIFEALLG